jgi:hypothetical protein
MGSFQVVVKFIVTHEGRLSNQSISSELASHTNHKHVSIKMKLIVHSEREILILVARIMGVIYATKLLKNAFNLLQQSNNHPTTFNNHYS